MNDRGRRTWDGKAFNPKKIAFIRFAYKLASRFERLRRRGVLTRREVAERFNISQTAVFDWGHQGLIKKCYSDTLNRGLWEVPQGKTIIKGCGGRGARPARLVPYQRAIYQMRSNMKRSSYHAAYEVAPG